MGSAVGRAVGGPGVTVGLAVDPLAVTTWPNAFEPEYSALSKLRRNTAAAHLIVTVVMPPATPRTPQASTAAVPFIFAPSGMKVEPVKKAEPKKRFGR